MFCFQCQETGQRRGCTAGGVCGKSDETANLQDLLLDALKGLGVVARIGRPRGVDVDRATGELVLRCLYATVTNTNFDSARFYAFISQVLDARRTLAARAIHPGDALPACATWDAATPADMDARAWQVGVLDTTDEDVRSLRETTTYALKGIAAWATHAAILGHWRPDLVAFVLDALAEVATETDLEALLDLALRTGRATVDAMALLDGANRATWGTPTSVRFATDVGDRPGVLVSGHDLADLEAVLHQADGQGIDVYTHGEMIAAHGYPAFRTFPHLRGNYGGAWWRQDVEFARFNGPILMTSNCIVPVQPAYADRIFTTGVAGYPGVPHLPAHLADGTPDFSAVVARARTCPPPLPVDPAGSTLWGGFGHDQLWSHAEALLDLVRAGRLRRVVVIGGCDGREICREYYKDVALALPPDTLILTAGCTKYMFCKLPLGELEGVPRVLDAGQCNDCYSLVAFALRLQAHLGLADPNQLPLSVNVAWYDQKAVAALLALLALGFRKVRLGPTLPAFFSPRVREILAHRFDLRTIDTARADVASMMAGD